MTIKVGLLKSVDNGCWAVLESHDCDSYESMTIAGSRNTTIGTACRNAAKRLRLMAHRFEALANEKDPYQRVTQTKINKRGAKSFE